VRRIGVDASPGGFGRRSRGSVLLMVLFFCVGLAVAAQVVTGVVVCARRGLLEEQSGRRDLGAQELALESAQRRALREWTATSWDEQRDGSSPVRVSMVVTDSEWLLSVCATRPSGAPAVVAALLERAYDGPDLPSAALVAEEVVWGEGRTTPWLDTVSVCAPAQVYVLRSPASGWQDVDPPGVTAAEAGYDYWIRPLTALWGLDEGWRDAVESWKRSQETAEAEPGVLAQPGERVVLVDGRPGETVRPNEELIDTGPEHPVLLIVTGGACVDLRSLGEVWGTVVADGGGVWLEGTVLHGALFATHEVDLGQTGVLVYDRQILRWATDRSLVRVRLLPGSREERME